MSLRAYATRRIRRSQVWLDQFNSTIGGLEVTFKLD
jgi:hypothetical protein